MSAFRLFLHFLMPSWKLYVNPEPDIILQVRFKSDESVWGEWRNVFHAIPRSLNNFWKSAEPHYLHACQNHLKQFIQEVNDQQNLSSKNLDKEPSYKILENMVRFQIQHEDFVNIGSHFQFRLCTNEWQRSSTTFQDPLIVSRELIL